MRTDADTLRYYRAKLPRGQSHTLKRTALDEAMSRQPGVDICAVHFGDASTRSAVAYFGDSGWIGKHPVADAAAWLPLCSASWYPGGFPYEAWYPPQTMGLSFYAVPSERRRELSVVVEGTALPALLAWGERIVTGDETGRMALRRAVAGLADDELVIASCRADER